MADELFRFNVIDRHKILSDKEWDFYIRAMPRDVINETFARRLLIVSDRDSQGESVHLIRERALMYLKRTVIDRGMYGLVYFCNTVDLDREKEVYTPTDVRKSATIAVYFSEDRDKEEFMKRIADGFSINQV